MPRHHDSLEPIAACDLSDVSGGAGMTDMLLPMIVLLRRRSSAPPAPPQQQAQAPALPPLPAGAERTVYYSDGTTRSG